MTTDSSPVQQKAAPTRWKQRYNSEVGCWIAGTSTGAFIGALLDDPEGMNIRPVSFAVMAVAYLVVGLTLRLGKPGYSRKSMARFFLGGSATIAIWALIAAFGGFDGITVTPLPSGILAGVLTAAVISCEIVTRRRRSREREERIQRLQQDIAKIQAAADVTAEPKATP